jgi:hypothetical protein
MPGVAANARHQVWHEVVAPAQQNVDVAPRRVDPIAPPDETVVGRPRGQKEQPQKRRNYDLRSGQPYKFEVDLPDLGVSCQAIVLEVAPQPLT